MFRKLRIRLTLLYLLVAVLLVALIGGSTYGLLSYYFRSQTDMALRYKMAQELRQRGSAVPPELQTVEAAWRSQYPQPASYPAEYGSGSGSNDHPSGSPDEHGLGVHEGRDEYNAELAAVFVLPLDSQGRLLSAAGQAAPPFSPDEAAAANALRAGSDLRTVTLGGVSTRLLTYRVRGGNGIALLQLGRTLSGYDWILDQMLLGIVMLGLLTTVALGGGAWWLAGRSLHPLEDSWHRQRTFIANAGHELKAPLTLLRASAEVLLRRTSPEDLKSRELLGNVLAESDHMTRLVEELLLLSRLDTRQVDLDYQPIDTADLLRELSRQFGLLAARQGVEFTTDGEVELTADRMRIRQVLLIVLDNALRHTQPGGSIRLSVHREAHLARFVVTDTGSGIAPEHLPHVFDRFYRAESSRAGATVGTGLGLSIARALIQAHQGRIKLTSELGVGTRVEIDLPVVPTHGVLAGTGQGAIE